MTVMYYKKMMKIYDLMMEYQKENNVVRQCMVNTQYFVHSVNFSNLINHSDVDPIWRAKAVMAVWTEMIGEERAKLHIVNHMVAERIKDSRILDPSYEINKEDPEYFDSVHTLAKAYPITQDAMRKLITTHLEYIEYADQMNAGDLAESEHYHKQADYLEAKLYS